MTWPYPADRVFDLEKSSVYSRRTRFCLNTSEMGGQKPIDQQNERLERTSSHLSQPTPMASPSIKDSNKTFRSQLSVGDLKSPKSKIDKLKANVDSKNGNMVLQLVFPSSSQNSSNSDNNNYLTTSPIDEILGSSASTKRETNNGSIGSQQDVYSTLSNDCFINQGYSNDLGEYNRRIPVESIPQTPMSSAEFDFKSTSQQEKGRNFRKHFTRILSSMYALFVITLGIVVYITEAVIGPSQVAETFSLFLVITSLIFVIYLIIDIRIYMKRRELHANRLEKNNIIKGIEMKECSSGEFHLNITLPKAAHEKLHHSYCLSKDRHSANFYLKVGAAGFCVGHLIHTGLLLAYQILFLTSNGDSFDECATVSTIILDALYPIYSFLLLYFIFKYSNIIINRHMAIVRFGLMHCISSSLCFWVSTILRETMESLANQDAENHKEKSTTKVSEIIFSTGTDIPVALPLSAYDRIGAEMLRNYLNTSVRLYASTCKTEDGLSYIYQNYSPYLYPFSVEYSILVVGILFVIWDSVGNCKEREEMSSTRQCDSPGGSNDNLESNIVIHADCHSANKGLFGGIAILVLTLVTIILFFTAIHDEKYTELGVLVNSCTSLLIMGLMVITGVLAYRQITRLDVSHAHLSFLDDLLLFICIPAYFLNAILSIIPGVLLDNSLNVALVFIEITQVLVQTPMIIDGLRRCSNSKELRRKKPGRELLTFLIVCNIAMWITQTFEVKSHVLQDIRYEFYGRELWTIVGHMCIPLMMFYRFHSSVCIVDIWKFGYETADAH